MLLVVDANIVVSAILKKSASRSLLFNRLLKLYCPAFVLSELEEHKDEFKKKLNCDEKTFREILRLILSRITLIETGEYVKNLDAARAISPDPDDVPYVAMALTMNCGLWTRDKKLLNLTQVKTVDTRNLIDLLYGKSEQPWI